MAGTPNEHFATFVTQNLPGYGDGYAEIELKQDDDGATLLPGRVYGLREIETPIDYAPNGDIINYQNPHTDSFYCYIFRMCEDGETADYTNYIYLVDDIMTVRNTPESIALHLKKVLSGNSSLTDAEKDALSYQIFRKKTLEDGQSAVYMPIMTTVSDPDTGLDIEALDPRFVSIAYDQVAGESGADLTGLTLESGATVGEYLLVEYGNEAILDAHPDWRWRGTYTWSDGATGNFSNASHTVYDANGENPQTVIGIEFTVTSQEIRDAEDKSVTINNSYTHETVNLIAAKRWASPSGTSTTWPSGKSVQFTLGTLDANDRFVALSGVSPVTLDNQRDANGEETAGSAIFKNLPKYEVATDGTLSQIRYAVRETKSVSGYNAVYPDATLNYAAFGNLNLVTIRNQAESTSITVSKQWDRQQIPAGATATFRLYAYTGNDPAAAAWVSNVNDIALDGVADEGEDTFGERVAWQASFTGLPLYNDSSQALHYIVQEISATPHRL